MRDEFARLLSLLPRMPIIVGGCVADRYAGVLTRIEALRAADMEGLRRQLDSLRYAE